MPDDRSLLSAVVATEGDKEIALNCRHTDQREGTPMNKKFLTLGVILTLTTAGAVSAAPVASAGSTARIASVPANPPKFGSCNFGSFSTIWLNATPQFGTGQIHVDVRIKNGSLFPAKQRWYVNIAQTALPTPSFKPNFTAFKQSSFGKVRVQILTEPIGFFNYFKATANNITTGEFCSTPYVKAG
jgi:hypothetical protein